jgi:ferredoxin
LSRIHILTGERSRVRRWALHLFAGYIELPLLKWGYLLLRGRFRRLGRNHVVRGVLSWAVAAPFGYAGDTARPLPTPQTLELIDGLDGPIAAGPCRCRSSHHGCDHPLDTDLVIRTGVEAWTRAFPHEYRLISKDEAKTIVSECSRLGLWQMVFIHCPVNRENEYVICNCCPCGCVPYILNRELGQRVYPLLRGDYLAVTDPMRCIGHGACVAACPFEARAVLAGKAALVGPCFGCGVCARVCPEDAIAMRHTGKGL